MNFLVHTLLLSYQFIYFHESEIVKINSKTADKKYLHVFHKLHVTQPGVKKKN